MNADNPNPQRSISSAALAQYGVVDSVGQFSYNGNTGYGLYEHGFFGPFEKLSLNDRGDLFP